MSFWRWLIPISRRDSAAISKIAGELDNSELHELKKGVKNGKMRIGTASFGISLVEDSEYQVVEDRSHDQETEKIVAEINTKIEGAARLKLFQELSSKIRPIIGKFLAPQIIGIDQIKEAVTLQLFSDEQVNILLLGDPGTGKTEILQSISEIAPIASFGLGSGMSGVGLTVTVSGKEVRKGLLALADKGICCVDELNLIKKEDVGSLYNAMEKGYITYDKGGAHYRFEARVSILASANPRYSQFLGKTVDVLRKELPFDSALLTRFHLVFFTRKPGVRQFEQIAKKILKDREPGFSPRDRSLVKEYITYAKNIKVEIPSELQDKIVFFTKGLKEDEKRFLLEINPRIVVGIARLVKAQARMELRDRAEEKDVHQVFILVKKSLYLFK